MARLNKEQQIALRRVYDRTTLFPTSNGPIGAKFGPMTPMTYLAFRRTVQFGFDCAMVRWCGMWLGIESDGYTHS